MAIMDETSCRWSSIPASKRASHVIIIGFVCMSLAMGLSNGSDLRSRQEHADTRQHHNQHLLTLSSTYRDADQSAKTNSANILRHFSRANPQSAGESSSQSSNVVHHRNAAKVAALSSDNKSSSSSLSLLTASLLLRLNVSSSPSSHSLSSGLHREPARVASDAETSLSHRRPASQAEARNSTRRVRRWASNRGNHFIYKPNKPTQLFCRTNYRLAVHEDGTVNGTRDNNDVYSSLIIEAQRRSYVSIKGIRSKLYVCVNDSGVIYGSKSMGRHCFFQESIERNFFNTYAFTSKRRPKRTLFLTINKFGTSRLARVRSQKKAQFITLVPPPKLL